jgi:signal transduction histidine kinase
MRHADRWRDAARRHARRLHLLQNVSHQLATALEVDDVLERLVQTIHMSLGYQLVAAALIEGDELVFYCNAGPPDRTLLPLGHTFALDGPGLTAWAARHGAPVLAGDVAADPRYIAPAELASTRSELVVPIISGAGVIGVIDMQSERPYAFDRHDLELLTTVAEFAATAIEKARLYEAEQDRRRELERLYQNERLLVADMEHSYNELLHTLTELERRDELLRHSERLSALGELASGIAHDFNNLLAGILGNAQLLLIDEFDLERQRMLGVIEQAAQDGAATVRRIQEFARKSERHAQEDVGLAEVIDGALAITRPRWHNLAQREGRLIKVRRELEAAPIVLGSAAELRELLINLIINAVDAMPSGGVLTLRLAEVPPRRGEPCMAVIEVCDSGVGIPPELHDRVFESFYSTKPDGKGNGLGLAMCRQIVARHGGQIELSSVVGQGTTFRVLLPVAGQPLAAATSSAAPTPAAALRVLVADDDKSVRDVLARILQRAGHEVIAADSGEQALARFSPRQFDLLFTDLSLPGIDGATLVGELRARDPRLAVVIVTGWGQADELQPSELGADALITKPFNIAEIHRVVGEIAQRDQV